MKQFRIGIVGGMGPRASILLEERIVEATPATRDQDHLEVLHFSNPKIPDRTESLARDGGALFVRAVQKTARTLVRAGASIIVIPCHTSHARIDEIERAVRVPVMNIVKETLAYIVEAFPQVNRVGLLATDGTIRERVFEKWLPGKIKIVIPSRDAQVRVMRAIYGLKAGTSHAQAVKGLEPVLRELDRAGAEVIVLGCTDLSPIFEKFKLLKLPVIDPLRITANHLVRYVQAERIRSIKPVNQTEVALHRKHI